MSISKEKVKEALKKLMLWVPEGVPLKKISRINYPLKHFPKKEYGDIYVRGDDKSPFISEKYLYHLLGKEDARTLFGLIYRICEAADISMDDLEKEIYNEEKGKE